MTELDQQLADLTDQVRRRIATSPKLSHTARQAQRQLDALESPYSTLTTAAKVEALQTTLRDYQRGLQYSDSILNHPGDRRRE